ncbi:MAG: hypothetical protein PWP04_521 [Candidatus Atribacteria bacterium]|nr:hypothetical protein [Candidatus Atribacteria bacterium]
MAKEQSLEGEVRVNVSTILDVVAQSVSEVTGVLNKFEDLVKQSKVSVKGEILNPQQKVLLSENEVEINLSLTLDPNVSFVQVAQQVQSVVLTNLQAKLGISPRKVNVEVAKVDWNLREK